MLVGTFIFKPEQPQIAMKVLEAFTTRWLSWDECGAYINMSNRRCPEGYYRLEIELEGVAEEYTESCWNPVPVTAADLADHMFITLYDQGFFEDDDDGETIFSFEDRDLAEVIIALAENNSRIISPWMDDVWIADKGSDGKCEIRRPSTLDYLLETA